MENKKLKYVLYSLFALVFVASVTMNILLFVNTYKTNNNTIFQNSIYSVVEIKATTESVGESFGTAVFVKSDGTLITNAHVVTYQQLGETYTFDNYYIRFSFEEDYREVSLVKYDSNLDLAVMQLNDTNCIFKALTTKDSSSLNNGDEVIAIGNLNNSGLSFTKGYISNSSMNVIYEDVTRNVIQCDITIANGNSGGALLDENGKLIGITTFRLRDTQGNIIYGISYCIPINTVLTYI